MPIPGIRQPEMLPVDEGLRLRKFDGQFWFAHAWYQDVETVWLVDGIRDPYSMEKLDRMYRYLNAHGELYFIEVMEEEIWTPVGDVTFWQEDMPIVIGDSAHRGQHIGRRVIAALIERGRELGYSRLYVEEIYDYNTGSRRCFESLGFRACEQRKHGHRYCLEIG